jgi:hypothetical protein
MSNLRGLGFAAAVVLAVPAAAVTVPVDLSGWTAEGTGNWTRAADNNSVFQSLNTAAPTVFYAPGNARGLQLSGTIRQSGGSDDDFIGFVLGYQPGDLTAATMTVRFPTLADGQAAESMRLAVGHGGTRRAIRVRCVVDAGGVFVTTATVGRLAIDDAKRWARWEEAQRLVSYRQVGTCGQCGERMVYRMEADPFFC